VQPEYYDALFLLGILVAMIAIYLAYVVYNKKKPQVSRNVRVVARRVGYGRGPSLFLTFEDKETGEHIEKALPMHDRELFNHINIGDEGILITQGSLYVSFTQAQDTGDRP